MTTPKSSSLASTIAWPSLIWIGGLHLGRLLAFVPRISRGARSASAWSSTGSRAASGSA